MKFNLITKEKRTMVQAAGADPTENMNRDEIKAFLLETCDRHIAARETYTNTKTDAAREYTIHMTMQDGMHLSVITMKAEGLTMDDFRSYWAPDVFPANMTAQEKPLTCEKTNDDLGEGYYCMYQHIKTPMVVSNRCLFQCVTTVELENGGCIQLVTSKGMKGIEEASTAKIGKDVLAHAFVVYQKAEPCDGGVRMTCVFCIELGGSLPDFIKKKIAEEQSLGVEGLVKILRKKKGL